MSAIDDILKQVPISQLASELGVSKGEAKSASGQVIQSLLGGMTANAQDPDGEQALASALTSHAAKPLAKMTGPVKLTDVDTADGSKIVQHALGADVGTAAQALSSATGTNPSLLEKLMPMLAPIVMAYLGSKLMGGKSGGSVLGSVLGAGAGGGLGQMLGGMLGGQPVSAGGGLTDMLGGLFGGGQAAPAQQSGGGLLGGLLGGGQAAPAQQSGGGLLGGLLGGGAEEPQSSGGGLLGGLLGGGAEEAPQQPQQQESSGGGLLGGLLGKIL